MTLPAHGASPFLANVLTFVGLLRRAGVRTSLGQTLDFLQALELVDLGERQQVYHAGRSLLVNRREDLKLYDALFARFWAPPGKATARPRKAPRAPRHDPGKERPFTIVNYMAYKARRADQEIDVVDRTATFTSAEVLRRKDFSTLTPEELRTVRRLMEQLTWRLAERQTRRRERHRRGDRLALRATLRAAARRGALPHRLPRTRRRVKDRPLVVLADVSGSMEKLSRLVLQFFYGLSHSLEDVEAFLFGTRLTRVTRELRLRNVDRALDAASRAVPDWSGGTRIGESLAEFRRRWGRRVLRRGAVVLVLSDGWERGGTERLEREVRWLQGRCHRLVWLNPLAGRPGYQPLVEGMAAALPHLDDFLPVHNLESLEVLAAHLARLPRRRGAGKTLPSFPAHSIPTKELAHEIGR